MSCRTSAKIIQSRCSRSPVLSPECPNYMYICLHAVMDIYVKNVFFSAHKLKRGLYCFPKVKMVFDRFGCEYGVSYTRTMSRDICRTRSMADWGAYFAGSKITLSAYCTILRFPKTFQLHSR